MEPLEHSWQVRSRHATSDGVVAYEACRCGAWRVVVAGRSEPVDAGGAVVAVAAPPLAVSGGTAGGGPSSRRRRGR